MMFALSKRGIWKISFILMLLVSAVRGSADDEFLAGLRGGISVYGGRDHFSQVEPFAAWRPPCQWNFCSDWWLGGRLEGSAGWINGEGVNAFIGTLGPVIELHKGNFPLILEGGSSPTVLSQHRFGTMNFGDNFQFTSHIGLRLEITKHFSIGWRFQHMSNAGIAHPNPGLNEQMISASYGF